MGYYDSLHDVSHDYDARVPKHNGADQCADGGEAQCGPSAPTPAAQVVRRGVQQREVGEHDFEPTLRAEQEPCQSCERVQCQGAGRAKVLCKMHERARNKEPRHYP